MPRILHLSDLHLLARPRAPAEQQAIFRSLVSALDAHLSARAASIDLLVVTGDVFDSATLDPGPALEAFVTLHRRILDVAGSGLATLLVPGNHDRRRSGLFAPHRESLFSRLGEALDGRSFVHGRRTPFLAEVLPHGLHKLPLWIIAYDSTYLPTGLMSAGGVIRQEDLLHAASTIAGREPDWPVLFVLHHHLVPTPLTDLGAVEARGAHSLVRFGVERILPSLVSNADREELMMTALGAGTALSTLHTLGRAVVVLHGHKHYATGRLLTATREGEGDVLIVSAGSAGTAEPWNPTSAREAARLWPSFNVIELDGGALRVETVSFGYKGSSAGRPLARPLLRAARRGASWSIEPVPRAIADSHSKRLAENEALYELVSSGRGMGWDYTCSRRLAPQGASPLRSYYETVEGADGGVVSVLDGPAMGLSARDLPVHFPLKPDGVTRYRLASGVCRTVEEANRLYGVRTSPFEWLSLMNRYGAGVARLVVRGLGAAAQSAFASATDLGTGHERALPVSLDGERVVVEHESCPPRTLLRVYWPLEMDRARGSGGASTYGPHDG